MLYQVPVFLRKTIDKHYERFSVKVEDFNKMNMLPDELLDVVVFGSYINTNEPKVNDLRVGIRLKKHPELYGQNTPQEILEREISFLKAGYNTIEVYDLDTNKDVIFKDKYLYIMKNGKLLEEIFLAPLRAPRYCEEKTKIIKQEVWEAGK